MVKKTTFFRQVFCDGRRYEGGFHLNTLAGIGCMAYEDGRVVRVHRVQYFLSVHQYYCSI